MSELLRSPLKVSGETIQDIRTIHELNTNKYAQDPEKYASKEFRNERLIRKLGSLTAGELVLLPSELSGLSVDSPAQEQATITRIGELEKGREHSRTEVAFGQLLIPQDDAHTIAAQVAVKYVHPITASREFTAARAVDARMKERRTYERLGFVRHNDGERIGIITRYEPEVHTLDNYLWNPDTPPEVRRQMFKLAGRAIAELHNHNFIHGDAQAKNLAHDSLGNIRHLDTETYTDLRHLPGNSLIPRLQDIDNMFDPLSLKIEPDFDDVMNFTEGYTEMQDESLDRDLLDETTIQNKINTARLHKDRW